MATVTQLRAAGRDVGVGIEPIFRAHYARLVRALTLGCGDAELAADAVQEAFVRAHERWDRIGRYDDPVGWVRRVAVNLLRDDHRRTVRKRAPSSASPLGRTRSSPPSSRTASPACSVPCPASSASPWPSSTWTASPWPTSPTSWVWPRAR